MSDWPQDYVWPRLDPFKAEVGQRIWLNLENSFFDAIITDVGEADEDGTVIMTCERFPGAGRS